ncbi:DUF6522 family protein [Methylobacterium sp. P31]
MPKSADCAIVKLSPASAAELMEGYSVRLEIGHEGDWIVDPREFARLLGVSTEYLKLSERLGQVEARIASGSGVDAGLTHVTVLLHGSGWQGTFDKSGELVAEEMW